LDWHLIDSLHANFQTHGMIERAKHHDKELAAIAESTAAIQELPDGEARRRVLSYVMDRFFPETGSDQQRSASASQPVSMAVSGTRAREFTGRDLQGVARITDEGDFEIVLREFWASSRSDAAVRLARLAIHAHERLTGTAMSSRTGLTPLLKAWHLYDGNTRARLARERGIIRSGDGLSLDDLEKARADRSVAEMRSRTGTSHRGRRFRRAGTEPRRAIDAEETSLGRVAVFEHIENWGNFTNYCSIGIHVVDKNGILLWANKTELNLLGYRPNEYIGHFVGDFHADPDSVADILAKLLRFETVANYPARLRAKDGSIKYVSVNSNVFQQSSGEFVHSRCFTTEISEAVWEVMKQQQA
jgi:PAS domain S-box-containing protein